MSMELRLPKITAETQAEQMSQMKSYLYQMVGELNWALKNISSGASEDYLVVNGKPMGGGKAPTKESNDPVSRFNEIKALIIKSADIANAYYEKISTRLEGLYVAQSDFGAYQEATSQDIEANSTSIQQIFTNQQEISGTVDALQDSALRTEAYIRTGLLYYSEDGSPVYGMEIGQTDSDNGVTSFSKFARFSSGMLSFYDSNDIEVAYISDYKLYITNAQITGTLIAGEFEMDTSDGLAYNWIGGG